MVWHMMDYSANHLMTQELRDINRLRTLVITHDQIKGKLATNNNQAGVPDYRRRAEVFIP